MSNAQNHQSFHFILNHAAPALGLRNERNAQGRVTAFRDALDNCGGRCIAETFHPRRARDGSQFAKALTYCTTDEMISRENLEKDLRSKVRGPEGMLTIDVTACDCSE